MALSFPFAYRQRWIRWFLIGVTMAGVAVLASACAGQGSATAIPQDSPVRLEVSAMFISLENQAGQPLTDIMVSIVPNGPGAPYTSLVSRLENTEKHDIMLGDFRGRDGSPFSRRAVRPRAVRIEASDISGKKYAVEYPWTQ